MSAPERVACDITSPGTPEEMGVVGMAELASAPGLVAVEAVVSDSLGKKLEAVPGTVGLVSAGWVAKETVVPASPGEAVPVGIAEVASVSEWKPLEAVVSASCGE